MKTKFNINVLDIKTCFKLISSNKRPFLMKVFKNTSKLQKENISSPYTRYFKYVKHQ